MADHEIKENYNDILFKNLLVFFSYTLIFIAVYYLLKKLTPQTDFFGLQLNLSRLLIATIYAHIIYTLFYYRNRLKDSIICFWSEPASPYSLAVFRIGFYIFLTFIYGYQYHHTFAPFNAETQLIPLPYTSWYIKIIPVSVLLYKFCYYAGSALAICCALGLGNRYIAWANIFFSFYIIGIPMFLGKMFYMHMWFWISSIMAFTPSSHVLSIDWLIKKIKGAKIDTTPHFQYGLGLKFIWLHFGIIYFFSAIGKLNDTGLNWALGESMINQVQLEWLQNYYDYIPSFRIDKFPFLLHAGGIYALVVEIVLIFLFLSPKLRWVAIIAGLSIHQFSAHFLNLSFYDLQFLYILFLCIQFLNKKAVYNPPGNFTSFLNQNFSLRATLIIGGSYFLINSIFGFFGADSWPFSRYPAHSANVPSTFKRIEFEIPIGSVQIPTDSIGRKNHFRKDNYFAIDESVIRAYEQKDSLVYHDKIQLLWHIWQSNNPELKKFNNPVPYIVETPVNPDLRDSIIQKKQIAY